MDSILWAMSELRGAFSDRNMNAPILVFPSYRDGMEFIVALRQTDLFLRGQAPESAFRSLSESDGSLWGECKLLDLIVRWPENKRAISAGW